MSQYINFYLIINAFTLKVLKKVSKEIKPSDIAKNIILWFKLGSQLNIDKYLDKSIIYKLYLNCSKKKEFIPILKTDDEKLVLGKLIDKMKESGDTKLEKLQSIYNGLHSSSKEEQLEISQNSKRQKVVGSTRKL